MPESQPSAKTEMIEQLQRSIEQLQTVVENLKTDSVEELPPQKTVANLLNITTRLVQPRSPDFFSDDQTQITPSPEKIPADSWIDEKEEEAEGIDRFLPTFNGLQNWWDGILANIRRFLPAKVNNRLSDWGLTSFLASLIVVVSISSVLLFPKNPPQFPGEIAENLIPNSEVSFPDAIATPSELVAPQPPQPIQLAPPPTSPLTPEQSLIEAIQQEVTDLTQQYPEGVILSIEPNFLASQLTVILGNNWYQLNIQRQDNLANTIWQRAQKLAFRKFNLIGPTGSLLARNPVVGNKIIIIERQIPAPESSLSENKPLL